MNVAAWGATVAAWGPTVAVLGSVSAIALAWRQTHQADRHGVSSDEREARKDQATERRDTIADRDAMIENVTEDRDNWKARALAAEAANQAWLIAAQGHVPWDWTAQEIAHESGRAKDLGAPPPLRPLPLTEVDP